MQDTKNIPGLIILDIFAVVFSKKDPDESSHLSVNTIG